MKKSVGVLGIGTYLPPDVRKNDWWPEAVVSKWMEKRAAPLREKARSVEPSSPGGRAVAAAMAALRDDPFHGAVERRIIADGVRASDMELEAARNAIKNAGIDPKEIGLVLCNTFTPDYLTTNNACLLHHNLELSSNCLSIATEAACNAFMTQMALAEQMIAGGRAKYALLVQCCNVSPLLPWEEAHSAWFGDGCAAQIVGQVAEGRGVLAHAHRTHGEYHRTILSSVPGSRWYEQGAVKLYSEDHAGARQSFLEIPDCATEVAGEALAHAGVTPADVDFYAPHQPTRWFREVTQNHLRLTKARSIETFQWTASMTGANIPISLEMAQRDGLLRSGDLVLMFAGGAGLSYSGMLMRWGT